MINNYMKKHKHHIIPKHAGGTDDESNLIELTIEEHAEAHRILYETHGRWQDRVAWLSLSGLMNDQERIYEILSNSNPGGYKHTEQAKQKLSLLRLGEKNPRFGKPAPNRGIKRPGVGGRKKGTPWSSEERKKHMKIRGNQGYYDFAKDPIRCKKISDAHKGKIGSAKDKHWFNDGSIETYSKECPEGFVKGRLPRINSKKRGMLWFNNGLINKQFRIDSVEKGFVRGRILKK